MGNVTVFTDGSYCRRSGAGGWAYAVRHPALGLLEASGSLMAESNNHVEALALVAACERLVALGVEGVAVKAYCDSTFAMERFPLHELLEAGAASAMVAHTPAHRGARNANAGLNGYVDGLAKAAMRDLRDRLFSEGSHTAGEGED